MRSTPCFATDWGAATLLWFALWLVTEWTDSDFLESFFFY
jgi:hypothetical protein